jgi:GT2 family glycosyltransferase
VSAQNQNPLPLPKVFGGRPLSLGIQSVLYNNEIKAVGRSLAAIARATELAVTSGACSSVVIHYGDSSPSRCLTDRDLEWLRARYGHDLQIEYDFFAANLGSARGHNRLAGANAADILLIQNPDVVVSPRSFEIMLGEFANEGTGMVEAKQLPVEHPKDYDSRTGETGWATTASAMIPAPLFRQLDGFDSDAFFLYCDDVDFSWRVRLAGFRIIFQPAAVVFHDKRLARDGSWQPSAAEKYYSAEAALMITHKWSRPDLTARHLADFKQSGVDDLVRAAAEFERRKAEGKLPLPVDPHHRVGAFVDGMYAEHRFSL